ncbi:peroxisomal membrane protein 2 isoform X2 [Octodon degus]|uniref:Peroxisomal membrane protein 2 isoform X2 n=1 Tax=Octodon degus TaxID=10160 RepID=A0A6P3F0C2_OCTDE|nr:peroxisomal membrane protein 2 isoform X2 [Octodon degus]
MAPAASKGRAEPAVVRAFPRRALARYLLLLRLYPALTKAATSGILSALGNLLAQMIKKRQKKEDSESIDARGPLRYAAYGFFITGPLSHYFYLFLEHWVPPDVPLAAAKRLLLDRLLFAPAFQLLFFLTMNLLEGKDTAALVARVRSGFWPALRMNWRVWTPVQFININYVPLQFRVLFANLVALFWYAYLSSLGQ